MKPLSSLGIGLSLVFGCLLLALLAELYYMLWWKKRIANREIEDDYSSSARELFHLFCWRRPAALSSCTLDIHPISGPSETEPSESDGQLQLHFHSGSRADIVLKPLEEDTVENELRRLHNLLGPSKILFTIKEESKEDLESEDGKSRCDNKSRKSSRSRSLSDLLVTVETPYLTPLSSPQFFTPPLSPLGRQGFSPLFKPPSDSDTNKTPSPKFKFLKDAEEKLYRKRLLEASTKFSSSSLMQNSSSDSREEDSSFITITVAKNNENEH